MQLREDALAGLVPRCRYLSARYGLSEDEAHQWAAEAKADSQTDEQLTFGDRRCPSSLREGSRS